MNVKSKHKAVYFITFIDDFTRYSYAYMISHKSQALDRFTKFMNLVENQLDKKIKTLKTDRGREYLSDQFKQFCDEKGDSTLVDYPICSTTKWSCERT